jgi:putative tricarboxylic transport membrane protein
MQRVYQAAALCFAALSAFVVWESWNLEYYTNLGPGPGFFPLWLGVALGGLSLAWLVRESGRSGKPKGGALLPPRAGIVRILSILAALAAMAGLMNLLGFQLTMFLFLLFLLMVMGRQTLWVTLVVALLCSVGVYHLFGGYLDVALPASSVKFLAGLGL